MKIRGDDFAQGLRGDQFDNTSDVIVNGYFEEPLVAAEISDMMRDAEMMGIDLDDPEMLGAWLKNLINKVKTNIQKRKKGKAKSSPVVSISTGKGTANVGPDGLTYTENASQVIPSSQSSSIQSATQGLFKNPMFIAAAIGLPLIMFMKKRKRG